jgi:DNA-binding beta-propeller fold protein YncE
MLNVLDYITIRGDQLFVTDGFGGSVSRIEIGSGTLTSHSLQLNGKPVPHGVAIDPTSHLAFVSRSGLDEVEVFNPDTMTTIKAIAVTPDPDAILYIPAFGSASATIYVAHGDAKSGTFIDPSRQAVVGTIALGGHPEFAVFDTKSGYLYQNLQDTNEVIAIDLQQRKTAGRWLVDECKAPTGLAIDEENERLLVACGGNSRAAVFDIATHRTLGTYAVGAYPDTIAYDSGLQRIYTAGGLGRLSILQGDAHGAFHLIDSVSTHVGAHTLAVDPATHRLYVGYAGLVIGPRLAVFDAEPLDASTKWRSKEHDKAETVAGRCA